MPAKMSAMTEKARVVRTWSQLSRPTKFGIGFEKPVPQLSSTRLEGTKDEGRTAREDQQRHARDDRRRLALPLGARAGRARWRAAGSLSSDRHSSIPAV